MLEFIKECGDENLNKWAELCEYSIGSPYSYCASQISSFFETTFKSIYRYFCDDEEYERDPNLFDLLKNRKLTDYIERSYGFHDFDTVHQIRKKGNIAKHEGLDVIPKEEKREMFFCLYSFFSCLYLRYTNKNAPKWDERRFEDLLSKNDINQKLEKEIQALRQENDNLKNSQEKKESKHETFVMPDNVAEPIPLSNKQKEAVYSNDKQIVVVAGPGSGKTRVLSERIVHLIKDDDVKPYSILALSFSSKSANEIRKRIRNRLGINAKGISVKTFHSFGLQIIRKNPSWFDLKDDVDIIDNKSDTLKLALGSLSNEDRFLIKEEEDEILDRISKMKAGYQTKNLAYNNLFQAYNRILHDNGKIDFDDMISLPCQAFEDESKLSVYKGKYKYILVDEAQDLNNLQIKIVSSLLDDNTSLFIVGDDDQCIYEWRGANSSFLKDLASSGNYKVITMEENYRSDASIVNASSSLICRNVYRLDKKTFSNKDIAKIPFAEAYIFRSEAEESAFIAKEVEKLVEDYEYAYEDFVVLTRTRNQLKSVKNSLLMKNIPVYSQLDDRKPDKIKSVLFAIANINKPRFLNAAINFPSHLIDNRVYRNLVAENNIPSNLSSIEVFRLLVNENISFPNSHLFKNRFNLISEINKNIESMTVSEILNRLDLYYSSEDEKEGYAEFKTSMQEKISLAHDFDDDYTKTNEGKLPPLSAFLDYLSFSEVENVEDKDEHAVQLMTCHQSKGLEYPVVFIPGVQKGLFPSSHQLYKLEDLESERRLLYVSMTRAMKKLYMSCYSDPTIGGVVRNEKNEIVAYNGFLSEIAGLKLKRIV